MLKQTVLKKITQHLKTYKPEKVILFGSRAWGKPHHDSDFDLMIIKKTTVDPVKRAFQVRTMLDKINKSFDILVLTPKELQYRLKINDFFIQDIVNKGHTLYEKT